MAKKKATAAAEPPVLPATLIPVRTELSSIHEDPINTRKHGPENLSSIKASLLEFQQVEPLLIQKSSHRLIGGHGRLKAMLELGWTHADVVELDLTDSQARALSITLNRTAELAEWDVPLLTQVMQALHDEGVDMKPKGWTDQEMLALIVSTPRPSDGGRIGQRRTSGL
jgi:ParB-like chromosome segregation protein Spo0J